MLPNGHMQRLNIPVIEAGMVNLILRLYHA